MVQSAINLNASCQTPVRKAPSLDAELQVALEHARRLTAMYGTELSDVAVAWDIVEELLATKARQRQAQPTAFNEYCEQFPDALEARIYDV